MNGMIVMATGDIDDIGMTFSDKDVDSEDACLNKPTGVT